MSDVVYLYGYVPSDDSAVDLEGLRGLDDRPVELVHCGPAAAVVSRLSAGEYSADAIEARLSDLGWVGEKGLAHERVVAALVDRTTVVPMRLFTLFSGEDALRDDCSARADWLRDTIGRLDGMRQWDVKVSYDAERMLETIGESSEEVAALDAEIAGATPGRRYLLERRRDDVARGAVRAVVVELARVAFDALAEPAEDARRLPPPSAGEPGDLPVVLAGALLVHRDREAELQQRVAERASALASRGVRLACSGPWAAYRFLDV